MVDEDFTDWISASFAFRDRDLIANSRFNALRFGRGFFMIYQSDRQSAACIARSRACVVLFESPVQVVGDACVERAISTWQDVNNPPFG